MSEGADLYSIAIELRKINEVLKLMLKIQGEMAGSIAALVNSLQMMDSIASEEKTKNVLQNL